MRAFRLLLGVALLLVAGGLLLRRMSYVPEVTRTGEAASEVAPAPPPPGWPCWRGQGNGLSDGQPPLRWSEAEGVLWKAAVPGRGHSSPVVCRGRVFLTTSQDEGEAQSLLCHAADSGTLLWERTYLRGGFVKCHAKNTQASSTCACDGQRVYVAGASHAALWLTAIDLDGHTAWQVKVGPYVAEHGYASSVALHGDVVLVAGENKGAGLAGATSYLAAFRRQDGQLAWRVGRPLAHSYGTPIVARVAGRPQALLGGAEGLTAHDPSTGRLLWEYRWERGRCASAVACGQDIVFASKGIPSPRLVAVRAGGAGDVTDTALIWEVGRGAPDVPSPLWHEGRVYLVSDLGIASCLDAASGKVLWQQRLAGPFSASPVLAAGRVYACNEKGATFVVEAGPHYRLLSRNQLDGAILASPAPVGDRLYLRSEGHLYALGHPHKVARAPVPPQPKGSP